MGILRKLLGLDRPSAGKLGRQGESSTAYSIDWNNYWACDGRLLRNVYIPRENGSTSEIDVLYITRIKAMISRLLPAWTLSVTWSLRTASISC